MDIIEKISFELDYDELLSHLGVDVEDEEDIENFNYLFSESCNVGKPKIIYKESEIQEVGSNYVIIDGVEFESLALSKNLLGVKKCYPYVVTCGREIDLIKLSEDSTFVDFWKDEIKARLLQAARRYLNYSISEEYGIKNLVSMAPGSADIDVWKVDEQQKLFSLFDNYCKEIEVELTDSCLMLPNKTLSGIAFESDKDFLSCQLCQRVDCVDRKVSFDESLYNIIYNE